MAVCSSRTGRNPQTSRIWWNKSEKDGYL